MTHTRVGLKNMYVSFVTTTYSRHLQSQYSVVGVASRAHLLHVVLLVHPLLGDAADHQCLAGHLLCDVGRELDVLDNYGRDYYSLPCDNWETNHPAKMR